MNPPKAFPLLGVLLSAVTCSVPAGAQGQPDNPPAGKAEAEITVTVAADAEVFFDGTPTKQKGTRRVFLTPPLDVARTYRYVVLARWTQDGKPVERTRQVSVRGGAKVEVAFADSSPTAERPSVARSAAETGSVLRREAEDRPWQPVAEKEPLHAGDLLVGLDVGAAIVSNNGAVRLTFRGDLNRDSPFPVLETAVVLHAAGDADLDVTLDRGRIELTNTREKGPARVRLHVRDKSGEVILPEPGACLGVEIYGRWPRGVPFTKGPKPGDAPALAIVFLAVHGDVGLKGPMNQLALKAPPGPALIQADSLDTFDPRPVYLEKLPDWAAGGMDTERAKKIKAILARFRKEVLARGVGPALDDLAQSDDELERRGAVVLMGALDDLPRLGRVLASAKHLDTWDAAVLALRHWIGRGPGQDQKLYRGLIDKRGFKPREAEAVLQLLHSFGDDELAHPELYQVLINYLNNDQLAVRGLAHWHLVRLVPGGDKIAYDPLAPREQRDKAIAEWRKLVPSGKVPTAPEGK